MSPPQEILEWYDAHCHLQDDRLAPFTAVWVQMRRAGVRMAVTNATREEDWESVDALANQYRGEILPAWGIHPWHADQVTEGWEKRLERRLLARPHGQIGECGLDGGSGRPPMDRQIAVFREQIRLARELCRPLTIHCVKAWPALWHAFRREPPPDAFLLHSYEGSAENALRLAEIGARFSFSPAWMAPRRSGQAERFRLLPLDRILLETDAPNRPPPPDRRTYSVTRDPAANHPANLADTGRALAGWLGMDAAPLAERLKANSLAFWRTA